jgi:hypothetical protein
MKFKKIVGFGDSWMYGDELLDPDLLAKEPEAHSTWIQNKPYRENHCALGLLGKKYQVPTENFGIPGGSLRSTMWTYLWWLEHETLPINECLVLVYLTEADRETFYHPRYVAQGPAPTWDKFVHSTWVEYGSSTIPKDFRDMAKLFAVLSTSTQLSKLNYQEAVYFFEGQQKIHGMPLVQVNGTTPPCEIRPVNTLYDPTFNLIRYFLDRPGNRNREFYMPYGHPNEAGHKLIADMLQQEIDRVTI